MGRTCPSFVGSSTTAGAFKLGGEDDVAVDNSAGPNSGNVYIDSETAGLVFAFDSTGRFLWQTSTGIGDVCGVGVDSVGNPWFGDYYNGLQKLDPADGSALGSPILATGDSCHFAFDSQDNVALNHWHSTVELFRQDGTSLGVIDSTPGIFDVAVDPTTDSIYSDRSSDVTIRDESGNLVGSFGLQTFISSRGVAVNGLTGRVYATETDASGPKVYVYNAVLQHRMTVTVGGAGSGSVDASSGAISGCTSSGGTCSATYDDGTTVTLAPTPDAGSSFTGWTGCDSVVGDECTVTINADTNVTATFDPIVQQRLTVSKAGSGSGSVSSSPAGISCGATCDALFDQGTAVTLTATPAAHSTFTGWSGGGCSGTGTCRVTVNGDATVTATFALDAPTVTTGAASNVTQTGATVAGTVNPNGANVTGCRIDYGTSASYGSQVPCGSAPGSGTSPVGVAATLSGLTAGTTYHYRVVAANAGGTTSGGDATFTTAAAPTCATNASLCPPPPHRTPGAPKFVGGSSVTLHGTAVVVRLSCSGDTACTLTVKLITKIRVGKGRHRHKANVVIATKKVTIAAGKTASVKLTLSRTARKLLASKHTLVTTLTAGTYKHKLVVKAPKKKSKKRH